MRVGNAFRYDQLQTHVGSTQAKMLEAQNRVLTGKRINVPSDDAAGTRQLLGIGALRNGIAAYGKNIGVASGALSMTESVYGDLGDLVQQAQTLTIQGATATLDQTARDGIADQIASLQGRLVSLGNSQGPDGRYLFGGQLTDTKPFSLADDKTLVYGGNAITPSVETGPGESVKVGETGGRISELYDKLSKLQNSLRSGNVGELSNDRLAEIKASGEEFVSARANVGRRMNDLDATKATHERRDAELTERASDIGEVDYATAIMDYTAAQSAYEAALQVASKGFSMGLMDFIR